MIQKRLIRPDRARQVPPSFSWVDHRLVSDHHLDHCDCPSLAIYLFLVTVSDVQGLSYYSDAAICRRLQMDPRQLSAARIILEKADLIAYRKPLYQVLSIQPVDPALLLLPQKRAQEVQSAGDILKSLLSGGGR